jgi:hypothetical protein
MLGLPYFFDSSVFTYFFTLSGSIFDSSMGSAGSSSMSSSPLLTVKFLRKS